jgi:hypothetical protein
MFKIIRKEDNKIFNVYDIRYDAISGYPQFLIYEDNQWLIRSAKLFEPLTLKTLNESVTKEYKFEDGM